MKIFYYIYTNHKATLDRVRRGAVIIKALNSKGFEVEVLLNDFRAGLEAKEYGIASFVNIETILDVDVLVHQEDIVILDTPEDDKGKIADFVREYKKVFRVVDDNSSSKYGEEIINLSNSMIVDEEYQKESKKIDRVLFFYGDSDSTKEILKEFEIFKNNNFDLLLGNYFYLGYEDELKEFFNYIYESDEYINRVSSYQNVVTYSLQCAVEAKISKASVVLITLDENYKNIAKSYNIAVIDKLDDLLIEKSLKNQKLNQKSINDNIKIILKFIKS
ncbi:hypothetical protein MNB_SV-15-1147 [hydrothermal vent metagenome]|uniref:Uncharacterized protein n=1 Tax=hydrothermal vent metagenome TaxID=652676 RepID=A0A1W1EL12_9ZZZZ